MSKITINIEDVKTLKLNKNEMLVFNLGSDIKKNDLLKFKKQFIKAIPKFKDRVLFLAGDVEMTKVRLP